MTSFFMTYYNLLYYTYYYYYSMHIILCLFDLFQHIMLWLFISFFDILNYDFFTYYTFFMTYCAVLWYWDMSFIWHTIKILYLRFLFNIIYWLFNHFRHTILPTWHTVLYYDILYYVICFTLSLAYYTTTFLTYCTMIFFDILYYDV